MNKNLTDITVIVDRSGSMWSTRNDAVGGLNAFVEEQKKLPGDANFTYVQFDDQFEVVMNGVPLSSVGKLDLTPRGGTALLDAIGKTVSTTGERLSKLPENERPGLVVFLIVTDGGENSSTEYTKARVKEMIEHQTNVYQWIFNFIGSQIDAVNEGQSLGINSSVLYTSNNTESVFLVGNNKIARMRSASSNGEEIDNTYTKSELESLIS